MGSSKRENPDYTEPFLVMRTLRDMNMSKFVAEDVPLFLSLIDDIFPGIKADKATFPDVEAAMAKVATSKGLQLHPNWLAKCVQLYETYQVGWLLRTSTRGRYISSSSSSSSSSSCSSSSSSSSSSCSSPPVPPPPPSPSPPPSPPHVCI